LLHHGEKNELFVKDISEWKIPCICSEEKFLEKAAFNSLNQGRTCN
jgi:hypothetical protein